MNNSLFNQERQYQTVTPTGNGYQGGNNGKAYSYSFDLHTPSGSYTQHSYFYSDDLLSDHDVATLVWKDLEEGCTISVYRKVNKPIYAEGCYQNYWVRDVNNRVLSDSGEWYTLPYDYTVTIPAKEEYTHLKLWECRNNYAGTDLSEYYPIFGRHRESKVSEESNFLACKQAIEAAFTRAGISQDRVTDTLMEGYLNDELTKRPFLYGVGKFGDSMVGWTECVYLHKDTDPVVLHEIDDILRAYDEDCPLINEDLFNTMLNDQIIEYWQTGMSENERISWGKKMGIDGRSARSKKAIYTYPRLYEDVQNSFYANGWA